jgi:NAD(P)-dependent dehydrogenase (short-subunit alcohol dehydrogenase family)
MAGASRAVLITGCSTGIGRATALELARRDWKVYATARRLESISDLGEMGCELLELDVCDESSMASAVGKVESSEGAVGVLVNNAGFGQEGAVESISMEDIRRQFETNFFGLARLTQMVLPGMRRQGWGKVVNMSSAGGRFTFPGGGVYHATKYAVEALSDALRFEVRGFGIDVILIEPGFIKSSFGDTALAAIEGIDSPDEGAYEHFNAQVAKQVNSVFTGPMSRLAGEPEDVGRVVAKAISARRPKARYPVTVGARLIIGARRFLPDRAFDAVMRTQFPTPR